MAMAMATYDTTTRQRSYEVNPYAVISFMEKLLFKIYEYFDEQDLVDVTFKLSNPTALVPAHRLILSAASPYFRELFKSDIGNAPLIEITDIDSDTFERIVSFCYTGKTLVTLNNVDEMLKAALILQLDDAVVNCVDFVIENIKDYTLERARQLAFEAQCEILKQKILDYEIRNFMNVSSSAEFLNLDAETLQLIIANDKLHITSEIDVFDVVKRWYEHDASARKEHLPDLVACLRLTQFNTDFIMENIQNLPGCHLIALEALAWHGYPTARSKLTLKYTKKREGLINIEESFRAFNVKTGAIFKYSKTEDLWQKCVDIPITGSGFRVILMDENLIFTGGCLMGNLTNEVRSWNFETKTFKQLPAMNKARASHSLVILDEHIYAIGGTEGKTLLKSVERFSDANVFRYSDGWQPVKCLINARHSAGAVVFNNKIYVMGGCGPDSRLTSVECYDPIKNSWSQCADMNLHHCYPGVTVHNGQIYVLGTWTYSSSGTVECYDPQINKWSMICSLGIEYGCGIGSISLDNQLWAIGGEGSKCTFVYDQENNRWIKRAPVPVSGAYYCFTAPISMAEVFEGSSTSSSSPFD